MYNSYIWRYILLFTVIVLSLVCGGYLNKYRAFKTSIIEGNEGGVKNSRQIYSTPYGDPNIIKTANINTEDTSLALLSENKPSENPIYDVIEQRKKDIAELEGKANEANNTRQVIENEDKNIVSKLTEQTALLNTTNNQILTLRKQLEEAEKANNDASNALRARLEGVNKELEDDQEIIKKRMQLLNIMPLMNFNNPKNIASCYSVRQIVPTYRGPVVRLRRSADDNIQDFYSNGKQYNSNGTKWTTALNGLGTLFVNWLGNSTAYVVIWYDQSPNKNHAINNETNDTQPIITSRNGNWVIQFQSGNYNYLSMQTPIGANTIFTQCYHNTRNIPTLVGVSDVEKGNDFLTKVINSQVTIYVNNNSNLPTDIRNLDPVIEKIKNNSLNTVSIMSDNISPDYIDTIGSVMNSIWFDGYVSDIILHNKPMSGQDATDYFDNRLLR